MNNGNQVTEEVVYSMLYRSYLSKLGEAMDMEKAIIIAKKVADKFAPANYQLVKEMEEYLNEQI